MKHLAYPAVTEYALPKKNILVISCMDLRLTDNLVDFLHFDNLQNRYDHFILAGSSLMCSQDKDRFHDLDYQSYHAPWTSSLVDHVDLALKLHAIDDVYIVEHQDCGAYKGLLKKYDEAKDHKSFSSELAERLHNVPFYRENKAKKKPTDKDWMKHYLTVTCFFIDLRGNVKKLGRQKLAEPSNSNLPPNYVFREVLAKALGVGQKPSRR